MGTSLQGMLPPFMTVDNFLICLAVERRYVCSDSFVRNIAKYDKGFVQDRGHVGLLRTRGEICQTAV